MGYPDNGTGKHEFIANLTEANPGIELGILRLEQRKRRWLDRSTTAPTHNIAQKW